MRRWIAGIIGLSLVAGTGCAVTFTKRSPWDIQQLAELSDQLEQFKTLARLKAEEADQLRHAKAGFEQRLGPDEANIGYDERGLVARMLDQVLFDSGKAELRGGALAVLDKVVQVLQEVPQQPVGVEGHTDNQPIKHSGWPDNQTLSLARATAVADYLVEKGVSRDRLIPAGHGESRPIASNGAAEGRQQNRRVEIVILPRSSGASYRADAASGGRRSAGRYAK